MKIRSFLSIGAIMLFTNVFAFAALDLQFTTDITISPATVNIGDVVQFTVSFRPFDGPVDNLKITGGVDGVGIFERTYAHINAGAQRTDTFTWTATAGSHTAWFKLDPTHACGDSNYGNNSVEKVINIGSSVDLRFISAITTNYEVIGIENKAIVSFKTSEGSATVDLKIIGGVDVEKLFEKKYRGLEAGSVRTESFTWLPTIDNHTVWFELDPDHSTGDPDYTNNRIQDNIFVDDQTILDLKFTSPIYQSNNDPNPGDTVNFTVDFISFGNINIDNLKAECWIDNYNQIFEQTFLHLGPNAVRTLSCQWTASNDVRQVPHKVSFELDPSQVQGEGNYSNNLIEKEITVNAKPDLTIEVATGLYSQGQREFSIIVKNAGNVNSDYCKLQITSTPMSIPPRPSTVLQTFYIGPLESGDSEHYYYIHPDGCGYYSINIKIDSDNIINELNEQNNSWSKSFRCIVWCPPCWENFAIPLPDDTYLPTPCHTCPSWHTEIKKGDPEKILDNIGRKLGQGRDYSNIDNYWNSFLDKNNGLKPNSALKIITEKAINIAKYRLQNEADIKAFQKSLNSSINRMAEAAKRKLARP